MIAFIKRFSMALVFLFLVVFLMILGTLGVTKFGDKMYEDINTQKMTPRGEKVKL
jgi:multisubunit Na+/H+ antiporter MnhG subunit